MRRGGAHADPLDIADARARERPRLGQHRAARGRGHQQHRAAIGQDVMNLPRLQHRVDRHRHAPRAPHAKQRRHHRDRFGRVERHAIARPHTVRHQPRRHRVRARRQRRIGDRTIAVAQRHRVRRPARQQPIDRPGRRHAGRRSRTSARAPPVRVTIGRAPDANCIPPSLSTLTRPISSPRIRMCARREPRL